MDNANKPAYPIQLDIARQAISKADDYMPNGLTKRERFAMAAMQGILANAMAQDVTKSFLSGLAVSQADALLKELEATDDN